MDRKIYFDNAATTQVRKEVFEAMRPYLEEEYGNPSSVYHIASNAKKAIEQARDSVAKVINASPGEIFFTGSGTEADNWALRGTLEAYAEKGKHIITSVIEHHAILHTCEYLEKQGYEVTYLPVDKYGLISLEDLENAIRPDTVLVSIMFANNEIATIQPIKEIGQIAKKHDILFHTDAVQAFGHEHIDVREMNIDLLSLSGHKLGGPKGVAALFICKGVKIRRLIYGGSQERGRRAGTENVPGIVGLGVAAELAAAEMDLEKERLLKIKEKIIDGITSTIPHTWLNGHKTKSLSSVLNISFEFIEGESLLLLLDMKGIYASSGSACTSGSLDPSHVLLAIGLSHEKAHGSLRISMGRNNTEEEADYLLAELPAIVNRLREMSPLYEDYLNSKR